ncbi:MAG: hypothetical protein LAT84_04025 [Balneolia bacterium]|nr:hypothetical protein [Balneolia bacterium]
MRFEQPDPFQQKIARTFSYITTAFLIGATFYLFTSNLLVFTYRPDWIGTAMLVAYAFAYGNITYLLTRRYLRREFTFEPFSYLIGLIVLFPAIFLIRLKGDVFPTIQSEIVFIVIIIAGSAIGTWKGRQKGFLMYEELKAKQLSEQQEAG